MKLAILNLSNNITDYKTVSSAETLYLARVFKTLGHEVDIISNTNTENTISFENAKDPNYYDRVLVVNGAINFFGGSENKTIIENFRFMAKHKKPILYLLTDLRLAYKPLWPSISKRGWGYTEKEVTVKNVIIVSQAHNIKEVESMHPGLKVVYAPLERYKVLFHEQQPLSTEKTVDLIYGGSFRAGNREKAMIKYLFDTPYSVEFYGNTKLSQFDYNGQNPPNFTGKIRAEEVISYNDKAYASLVIGDNNYNGNMITLRVWEILLGNSVILIDNDFDPKHEIMGDAWFYVKNKNDVHKKIEQIKIDDNLQTLLDYQKKRLSIIFNKDDYLKEMNDILLMEHFEEDIKG